MTIVRHMLAATPVLLAMTSPCPAAITETNGRIVNLYADPSDFVIELDAAGSCGSKFFHVRRNHANFKEMTAISLTALSVGKTMGLFVESCSGDRNVLSHGRINAN
jgi:hypothetical protein